MNVSITSKFQMLKKMILQHTPTDQNGRNFCVDSIKVGEEVGLPKDSYIKRGSALDPKSPDLIQVMTPINAKAGQFREETFAQLPGSLFSWSPKLHHFVKNGGEVKGGSPAALPDVAYTILDGVTGAMLHHSIGYTAEDQVASLQGRVEQRIR